MAKCLLLWEFSGQKRGPLPLLYPWPQLAGKSDTLQEEMMKFPRLLKQECLLIRAVQNGQANRYRIDAEEDI